MATGKLTIRKATESTYSLPVHRVADASQHYNEHFCQEHNQEFKKRNGPHGEFYTHQVKGSKDWCNEARRQPRKEVNNSRDP
jgi:hypothetical protein